MRSLVPRARSSGGRTIADDFLAGPAGEHEGWTLEDGARVAVVGGGPAGSLFTVFLLQFAERAGIDVDVDVYEPRRFTHSGPAGCNHCGGIVSESLVQILAAEGVNIPGGVVRRAIDAYVLHTDVGSVRIAPPLDEKRIASVYRANGPRDAPLVDGTSFDGHLLELAVASGARVVRALVTGVERNGGRPSLRTPDEVGGPYDLVAVAAGVNSRLTSVLEQLGVGYRTPGTAKTFICEFELGAEQMKATIGDAMHVFLLDIPRLEFAAMIPKGDCATLCMLGEIDDELVERFFAAPEVRQCFPGASVPEAVCHCFPRINVHGAARPFADRVVVVGDSSVTRLYKDGLGAAYRTAKAAAATAVFQGVSADAFRRHYAPALRRIERDNTIGKFVFGVSHVIQHWRPARRAVLRMTAREQGSPGAARGMSGVLWDLFTGSAPYRDVLTRTLHPLFCARLLWNVLAGFLRPRATSPGVVR